MSGVFSFIKHYHLVIDNSRSSDEVLYIRSSICSEEQLLSFVEKLSQDTGTEWEEHYGYFDTDTKRFMCCKSWVCANANIKFSCKGVTTSSPIVKMEILLKEVTYSTKRTDTFLLNDPPLTCIIRLHFNYHCKCKWYYKHLQIDNDIQELFFQYFDNGCSMSQAKSSFIEDRQRIDFKVNHFVPSKKRLSYLYAMWREKEKKLQKQQNKKTPRKRRKKGDEVNLVLDEDHTYSRSFDVQTFISALPRKNPPLKNKSASNEDIVPDSPLIIDSEERSNLLNDSETSPNSSEDCVRESNILQGSNSVNKMLLSNNSNLPSVHVQRQDFSVNTSPKNLNGSIITVNSSDINTSPISYLNGCRMPPISSLQSPSTNSNQIISNPPVPSLIKSKKIAPKICLRYDKVFPYVLLKTYGKNPVYQASPPMCPEDRPTPYLKENFGLQEVNFADESIASNLQISSQQFSNSPTVSTSNFTSHKFSESAVTTSKQIHITSSALQSGAHVSMAPVQQPNPVIDTIYFSDSQSSVPSLDVPVKIKEEPQDESEVVDLNESEKSNVPVIYDVFSLYEGKNSVNKELMSVSEVKQENINDDMMHEELMSVSDIKQENIDENIVNEELISSSDIKQENIDGDRVPHEDLISASDIKQEKIDDDDSETIDLSGFLPNAPENQKLDDDHDFFLSLLPKLREVPVVLKRKLKSDIQNLVTSASLPANTRKRKASKIG